MKKWFVMTMIAALFVVAACSGNNGGNGGNASPTANGGSNTPTENPGNAGDDDAELTPEAGASLVIWDANNQAQFLQEMGAEFEKEYGVPVKFEEVGNTDQVNKLMTDGPAGLAADVLLFPHDHIGNAASAGLLLPNTAFEQAVVSENAEKTVKAVSFDGILYGYPRSVETYAMFYNKDLIAEAPATFDDIFKFAETFNDPANNKFTFAWELQQFFYNFAFLASQGGYMFGDDNTNSEDIGLNNDGAVAGANLMVEIKEKLLPLNTGDIDFDIKKGLFLDGSLALDVNGPWAIADYKSNGINFGVAPLPKIGDNPMTSFSGVQAYYVNANSKYPQAAQLLARFLSTKEAQMKNFEMNSLLPSNEEAANDPAVANDDIVKAFLQQFENSTPMPSIPEMGSVWNPITSAISEIWNEGKDPKTALDNAVEQIKSSIGTN
jgi:Maltose-binding periplasmic proteins/domains